MSRSSRCLVLSAHDGLIDRRIIAQANALALTGREVTLVSVPADGRKSLVPEVRVVMASEAAMGPRGVVRRLARRLPSPIKAGLRAVIGRMGTRPAVRFTEMFEALTPRAAYDVIHCHDLQTLPAGVRLRAQCAPGAKVIYDSHEWFAYQFPTGAWRTYWDEVEAAHIRQADAVITVNESIAEQLANRHRMTRPVVLYNSCHLHMFKMASEQFDRHFGLAGGGPPDAFRILFQGGFMREKNVEALARAMEVLGSGYQLFLLGGGELEPRLRRLAQRNSCGNVHVARWVAPEDLLGFVAHADAGVIPYLDGGLPNNHYCTPNKLFEYMQAGVPICGADLPELRRIVEGERLGRVYPLRTAAEIAQALVNFAAHCRAGTFPAEAFTAARDKYSWNRQAQRLLALYHQLGV